MIKHFAKELRLRVQLKKEKQASRSLVKYYEWCKEGSGEQQAESSCRPMVLAAGRLILRNKWNTAISKDRFLSSRGLSLGHRIVPSNGSECHRGLPIAGAKEAFDWLYAGLGSLVAAILEREQQQWDLALWERGLKEAQEAWRLGAPLQVFTVFKLGDCNSGKVIAPFWALTGIQHSQPRIGVWVDNLQTWMTRGPDRSELLTGWRRRARERTIFQLSIFLPAR